MHKHTKIVALARFPINSLYFPPEFPTKVSCKGQNRMLLLYSPGDSEHQDTPQCFGIEGCLFLLSRYLYTLQMLGKTIQKGITTCRRKGDICLDVNIRHDQKLVEIWLTNAEKQDTLLQEMLKPLYGKWKQKGYLVAVYLSGAQDLCEVSSQLLCHNRKRLAELEGRRQENASTGTVQLV